MVISDTQWTWFIQKLRDIDDRAAEEIKNFVFKNPRAFYDPITRTYNLTDEVIQFAHAVATKYGEASAALCAEMYDEIAALEAVNVPPAVPAPTATLREVYQTLYGVYEQSHDVEMLGAATGRLTKQAGVDTTVQNAVRDGAEVAFVPHGETCAYCIALAGGGWRDNASWALGKDGHVAHCHSNCDCTFAVRFTKNLRVAGYDEDMYRHMYYDSDPGGSSRDKINAMRRQFYQANAEKIREQKRDAYARSKALESSEAEEKDV